MPPEDNNTPAPEQPKKVGFWAKLFGKKTAASSVPEHTSQTPPPQLDDAQASEVSDAVVAPSNESTSTSSEYAAPAPTSVEAPSSVSSFPPVAPFGESQPSTDVGSSSAEVSSVEDTEVSSDTTPEGPVPPVE